MSDARAALTLKWVTDPVAGGAGSVVATGVYDVLHVGLLWFLRAARAAGDRLIIGIEDDERTRARKGPSRPIIAAAERAELVAALAPVDGVFVVSGPPGLAPAPAYRELLAPLAPAHLAFTAGDPVTAGRRAVAAAIGAETVEVDPLPDHSTTNLLEAVLAARAVV